MFNIETVTSIGILCSLLFPCLVVPCAAATASPAEIFPLQKGDRWVYEAHVRYVPAGSSEIRQKDLQWTMEVEESVQRDLIRGALIRGHPQDLVWYSDQSPRGKYIVLNFNGEKLYLIEGERVPEIWKSFEDGNMPPDAVTESDLIVEMPLKEGHMFGETAMLLRGDGMYVWRVEGDKEAGAVGLRNESPFEQGQVYHVTYRCLSSHAFENYVPGIGLTRYIFGHHGTVSDVDARLVGFYPAPSP